jgi:peptidoglycan-N-acetylglucosamine deacetylase
VRLLGTQPVIEGMRSRTAALLVAAMLTAASGCAQSVSGNGSRPSTTPTTAPTSPASPASPAPLTSPTTQTTQTTTPPRTSSATPPPANTLPSWLLGKEWDRIPTGRRVVALTFDAGADAAGVPSILSTLAAEHVPGTFFLTGSWVSSFPAQARAVCADHRIGDHSVTHPHLTALTDAQIRREVLDAATTLRRACAKDPAPLFRFPFGDRDARTIRVVNSIGYLPIGWTVDTLGWQGSGAGITVARVISRVVANAQPGEIVLMHVGANPDDHSTLDADALPGMIGALRSMGYGFVSLDALLTAR